MVYVCVSVRVCVQGDEFVIIASDGLWDYVGPNTAGSLVTAAKS